MGLKAVGPMFCVTHLKEPSALVEKTRGSPRCSGFNWLHVVLKHLVNHYMVLESGFFSIGIVYTISILLKTGVVQLVYSCLILI